MNPDDEIDTRLRHAGAEWRTRNEIGNVTPDLQRFQASERARMGSINLGTATAAVAVVALAVALAWSIPRFSGAVPPASDLPGVGLASDAPTVTLPPSPVPPTLSSVPSASPPQPSPATQDYALSDGEIVTGKGYIAGLDGLVWLCLSLGGSGTLPGSISTPNPPVEPECSTQRVQLFNVSSSDMPAAGSTPMQTLVTGEWRADGITVESVRVSQPATPPPPVLPSECQAPDVAWPGDIGSGVDGETELRALQDALQGATTTYSGYWRASLPDGSQFVTIVGTVGDPTSTAPFLRSVFPYNLCVIEVPFSADDLSLARNELSRRGYTIKLDVVLDRVDLALPFVDSQVIESLGPWLEIVNFQPMVVPQTTSS